MRPMSCREVEPHLLAAAMGEAAPAAVANVETHVADCPECRADLARYRAIDGMVDTLRRAPLAGEDATLARAHLTASLADARSRLVSFGVFPSPLGPLLIGRTEHGVALVQYLSDGGSLGARVRRLLGEDAVEDESATEGLRAELIEYLEGRRVRLDWSLDLRRAGSDFRRRVLAATAALPYGAVTSYAGKRVELKQRLLAVEGVKTTPDGSHEFKVDRAAMYTLLNGETEYCLPTCGSLSERPLADLILFGTRHGAEAAGFAPCRSCRPDLHPLRA